MTQLYGNLKARNRVLDDLGVLDLLTPEELETNLSDERLSELMHHPKANWANVKDDFWSYLDD